jgi:hypothetical protein
MELKHNKAGLGEVGTAKVTDNKNQAGFAKGRNGLKEGLAIAAVATALGGACGGMGTKSNVPAIPSIDGGTSIDTQATTPVDTGEASEAAKATPPPPPPPPGRVDAGTTNTSTSTSTSTPTDTSTKTDTSTGPQTVTVVETVTKTVTETAVGIVVDGGVVIIDGGAAIVDSSAPDLSVADVAGADVLGADVSGVVPGADAPNVDVSGVDGATVAVDTGAVKGDLGSTCPKVTVAKFNGYINMDESKVVGEYTFTYESVNKPDGGTKPVSVTVGVAKGSEPETKEVLPINVATVIESGCSKITVTPYQASAYLLYVDIKVE